MIRRLLLMITVFTILGVGFFLSQIPSSVMATGKSAKVTEKTLTTCGSQQVTFSGTSSFDWDEDNSGNGREQYRLKVTLDGSEILVKDDDGDWTAPVQTLTVGTHNVQAYIQKRTSSNSGNTWTNWSNLNSNEYDGDIDTYTINACPDVCSNIQGNQASVPANHYTVNGNCFEKTPVCTDDSANNFDNEVSNTEYSNNEVCEYSTHRWCSLQEDESYLAEAIPNNVDNPEGKPWETGMDRLCTFTQAGECPTACGQAASEVADGEGGTLQCEATPACTEPTPTPGPSDQKRTDRVLTFNRLCNMEVELVLNYIDDGNGVKDKEIKFYYNGEEKVAKTNDAGRAGVTYGYKGESDVEAKFDGDSRTTKVYDLQPSNCPVSEGKVLGATTMAGTGAFASAVASAAGLIGTMLTALGLRRYGKKN